MNKKYIQVAIDGLAAAGKSSIALHVANILGIKYISTGKMFRCYALACKNINYFDEKAVKKELKCFKFQYDNQNFYLNNINVSSDILTEIIANIASIISQYQYVRKRYRKDLKKIIKSTSIVIEGRDIGTAIIPKTPFKYYITATASIRAKRRANQLKINKKSNQYKKILNNIRKRDYQDMTRKINPLKKPKDALLIDTSNLTIDDVVSVIINDINKKKLSN